MIDAGGETGLALEAFQDGRARVGREVRHLEGDLAAQLRILGEVDGAHAALPQLPDDSVATKLLGQLLLRSHGDLPPPEVRQGSSIRRTSFLYPKRAV